MRRLPYSVPLKGVYKAPRSTPPEAKVSMKNHHKTMKIKVPEAEILRTPTKIEKLSRWNRTRSGFILNFEFHRFLKKNTPSPSTFFICGGVVLPPKNSFCMSPLVFIFGGVLHPLKYGQSCHPYFWGSTPTPGFLK